MEAPGERPAPVNSGVWPVPPRLRPYVAWFAPESGQNELAVLDTRRRTAVLLITCLSTTGLLLAALVLRLIFSRVPPWPWWLGAGFILVGAIGGPLTLRLTRSVERAATVTIASVALALPLMGVEGGGLDAPIMAMVPTVPLISAFLVGLRGAAAIGAVLAVEVVLVAILSRARVLPPGAPPTDEVKAILLVGFLATTTFVARIYHLERKAIEARLEALARELYESSIRDPLTGVHNRRYFDSRLQEELAFARRHDAVVGLILLDVDHFKKVNDQHGHPVGDQVLVAVAGVFSQSVRREDLVARIGGEEFAVLVRGVGIEGLRALADRLRRATEDHSIERSGGTLSVTVSAGCATVHGETADAAHLVGAADARLYEAKRAGRNRVVAA